MTRYQDHSHPPSDDRPEVDLEVMTVRELGEIAEAHRMTLLDILTL